MSTAEETIELAVNGTLMRGLELNNNLLNIGAYFVREDATEPLYRLWTIDDRHPAMIKQVISKEAEQQQAIPSLYISEEPATPVRSIAVEIWAVPVSGISIVLIAEPPGLCIGKVTLLDGVTTVLGVLGEPWLCHNQKEITEYGGWRSYIATLNTTC